MNLRGDFKAQVKQIMARQQLKKEHYITINKAIVELEWVLQNRWPGAKLTPFGSMIMGLGTPSSDIDVYAHIPEPVNNTTLVEEAASVLRQHPELFTDIYTSGDRIPIVNALHLPSHRDVDLSFTGPSSISNTRLLKYLYHRESKFLELAVIIQYWTKVHKLDDNTRYTFRLMVIFFLQQKGIFPSVTVLQKNEKPLIMDHWNTAFEQKVFDSVDDALFGLLVDFFEYYASFDYDRFVISPFVGYPVSKTRFETIGKLPKEFGLYKHNVENNITDPIYLNSPISVQEVFDHNRNIAENINDILAMKMIAAFRTAYNVYKENKDPDEFLNSILQE